MQVAGYTYIQVVSYYIATFNLIQQSFVKELNTCEIANKCSSPRLGNDTSVIDTSALYGSLVNILCIKFHINISS